MQKQILVISQSESFYNLIKRETESENYVLCSKTAEEILSHQDDKNYDLIILDRINTKFNSAEISKIILNIKKLNNIPLIFLINHTWRESIRNLLNLGDFVLLLPRQRKEVFPAIKRLIQLKKLKEIIWENKDFLQAILNNIPYGIKVDELQTGENLYTNSLAKELFYSKNFSSDDYLPDELKIKLKELFDKLVDMNEHSVLSYNYRSEKDDKYIYTQNTLIRDNAGIPAYQLTLFEDRTELEQKNQKLKKMAHFDKLTQLGNRRHIQHFLDLEYNRFQRFGVPFSILIADIDDFKEINDTYGHVFGDFVLRKVADIFKNKIRKVDKVARWGGEEFLFLLPETSEKGIEILANRIREKIGSTDYDDGETKITLTISIGGSVFRKNKTLLEVIKEADKALYVAKREGKNLVKIYSQLEQSAD